MPEMKRKPRTICGCGRKPDLVQNVDWDLPWSIRCHSSPDHAFVVYAKTRRGVISRWDKLWSTRHDSRLLDAAKETLEELEAYSAANTYRTRDPETDAVIRRMRAAITREDGNE